MLPGSLTVCLNKCLTDFATKETRAQNILYSSNEFATKRSSVLNFARILFLYGLSDSKRPNRGVAVVVQIIRIRTASPPFIRTSNILCAAVSCWERRWTEPHSRAHDTRATSATRVVPQGPSHKSRAASASPRNPPIVAEINVVRQSTATKQTGTYSYDTFYFPKHTHIAFRFLFVKKVCNTGGQTTRISRSSSHTRGYMARGKRKTHPIQI